MFKVTGYDIGKILSHRNKHSKTTNDERILQCNAIKEMEFESTKSIYLYIFKIEDGVMCNTSYLRKLRLLSVEFEEVNDGH